MDDLPSYEAATCPNAWTLIAPYLPSQALCSAALVSREWNKIFTPWLWGSPASHFGEQNDVVFVALTRFKRILSNARASVCELTHTLCLPPAHAEIYSGPHSEWLRDCLEYLPRLQCLIVNGLPFFDHASLLSLRYPSQRLRPKFPVFSLRLLDASGCMNATSAGLAEALPHFPDLVSLDLSKTRASRGKAVLSALKHLLNLRVLNLCGIGLKDEDFSIVAHSIRSRVRSLDISNNLLTDISTRLLLELCLKEIVITPHTHRGRLAPVEQEQGNNEIDVFESENLVGPLRKKLMGGFVGTLPIEEARDVGISHLYLSANNITIEGISSLLRSGRLKVLDAGVLPATIRNPYPVDPSSEEDDMKLPSVAKLVPILSKFARHKLRYVRLNYQIVTENAPIERSKSPRAELCGGPGAYERPEAHELENTELSMSELDSEFTTVQEIADYSYPIELPCSFPPAETSNHASSSTAASGHKPVAAPTPAAIITSQPPLGQQESPNYRNQTGLPLSPISPLQQSFENHRGSREGDLSPSWSPSLFPPTPTPDMQFPSTLVFETICQEDPLNHVEDMKVRLSYRQSQEPRLHPGMLPNLHTLVLTSVPIAAEKYMVDRIIQFIKDAADEASIARQSARNTYALPPGRRRVVAEEEYAHSLFALRRIVLEMASPQPAPKKISTSWRAYPTRSTTEDTDSEAFWEAASHDFSFFGDEECGQPSQQLARPLPLEAMSGLELATDHTHPVPEPREPEVSPRRLFDVIGEVGKFRRERKAAYEELVATGEANPDVKGYWPGDITVVRMPLNAEVGELDCYGNRYESGWYYR